MQFGALPVFAGKNFSTIGRAAFAFDRIIVELKALDRLTSREESQVINYLKASGLEVGLLINFGVPSLEWKRIVLTGEGPETADLQSKSKRNSR